MPPSEHPPDKQIFRVRLAQAWKVVLAIVLPSLLILPGIFLLAKIRGLPESVVFGAITVMVFGLCGASIWLVFRSIARVDYSIEGMQHRVDVVRPNFLTVGSFDFATEEVTGFQVGRSNERLYFTLMLRGYPGKFSINAASDRPEDVAEFEELMRLVAARLDERKAAAGV